MVDFKKKLSGKAVEKPTDPVKLYDNLDREADKGPLRPAQVSVLSDWYGNRQNDKDVIVKLHTGQGKTLIGLLMLQSRLNAGAGPVVYLCPDNYLVEQTRQQARQFGIRTCTSDGEIPEEFLSSKSIFVTSVHKLFNGMTKFGLNNQSIPVDTILMDDAHTCSDIIRSQCKVEIPRTEPAYDVLKTLFSADLEGQGSGTFADIENKKGDAFLLVPYWAWMPREAEITSILSRYSDRRSIKFAWPLVKDIISNCQCLISGQSVEIEPYIAPLEAFGSYYKAKHRIFMSATVTDDAFLVKGLQLEPKTILNPLTFTKETWSGEKMILVPSLIHDDLNHAAMITFFAEPRPKRRYGTVALVPSFEKAESWVSAGAVSADNKNISDVVGALRRGECEYTAVLANRYDGIDLPDNVCRMLIFDSKPYSISLVDLYQEKCSPNSAATLMRTVRSVEQGMGRSVRGEKDYSVIVAIGADLVRLLRDRQSRQFLSSQMSAQIEIGLEITEMVVQEIEEGKDPLLAFTALANQCIGRDEDWKTFYIEKMQTVIPSGSNPKILEIYAAELAAEKAYVAGDYAGGARMLQELLDNKVVDREDAGWYLQEQARLNWRANRAASQVQQVEAHKKNRQLLKPPTGVTVAKLTIVSQGRVERIRQWISGHSSYENLNVNITEMLGRLVFGCKADKFEDALNELSRALGFVGERPDAEWKEGPDNLWALDDKQYIIFECKSEVEITRDEINKREAEQMNRSSVWFDKHYQGMLAKRLMVHPAGKVQSAAGFTHVVEGVRDADLRRLVKAVREFFKEFEAKNLDDLSDVNIQTLLNAHKLSIPDILTKYCQKLKNLK